MKAESSFETHLLVNEAALPSGTEWRPKFEGWSLIQIKSGISYWCHSTGVTEIQPGSIILLAHETQGNLRASQLNQVTLAYFCVEPEKLSGLLSWSEQHSLKPGVTGEQPSTRVLSPADPVSTRFKNLCLDHTTPPLAKRLQVLQLFIEASKCALDEKTAPPLAEMDGRERLKQFLKQTAASEFLGLSLSELALKMHCSPRHLSRLFRQQVGVSFQEKQTEMRLAKARQLLATSNAKVIDVALTSGYHSNSLFNQMFKKHFGVSPGRWRRRHGLKSPPRQKLRRSHAV